MVDIQNKYTHMHTHNFQQNSNCKIYWELWVQKKGMEEKKKPVKGHRLIGSVILRERNTNSQDEEVAVLEKQCYWRRGVKIESLFAE